MINWFLRRQIDAFERTYDYDMTYARELLAIDRAAFLRYFRATQLSEYRADLPLAAWFTAKLVGTIAEDCGPCTQLGVRMAERAGVAPEVLRNIVAGQPDNLPEDARLAYHFARASLAHDPVANHWRDEVVQRWGRKALVSLTFAITTARIYPTIKYAMGHGHACSRVRVAGVEIPALLPA